MNREEIIVKVSELLCAADELLKKEETDITELTKAKALDLFLEMGRFRKDPEVAPIIGRTDYHVVPCSTHVMSEKRYGWCLWEAVEYFQHALGVKYIDSAREAAALWDHFKSVMEGKIKWELAILESLEKRIGEFLTSGLPASEYVLYFFDPESDYRQRLNMAIGYLKMPPEKQAELDSAIDAMEWRGALGY